MENDKEWKKVQEITHLASIIEDLLASIENSDIHEEARLILSSKFYHLIYLR